MKIKKIKNIFPESKVSRYNMAAWQSLHGESIYFIGREVRKAGGEGEPDTGVLKLFELDSLGKIVNTRLIWKPVYEGVNLEDPRVIELQNENLLIGVTAVLRDKKGHPIPFPAIIKIDSHSTWKEELPPYLIINTFGPGKNMTPVDNVTYFFRPENRKYNHKILAFALHHQLPRKLGDIEFPKDLYWAKWRIGTTMPPIWINETEALFIIHGISIHKIHGIKKYIYSIGRAKLTRNNDKFEVKVAEDPIITPDNFIKADGKPLVNELHSHRRVVYSCGGIIKKGDKDSLSLFVNVGDMATFEVVLSIAELKEGLF
ncbi:hypothetical protein IPM62_05645 [Candidatus Woesebacteria bacterium]|nr:MAG: hypothetical protein IPM62_05645 [Candidatus Woesebacteria bacterium]